MEPRQPRFESAMVVVDILDMKGPAYSLTLRKHEDFVGQAKLLSSRAVGAPAVGTQDGITRQTPLKDRPKGRTIDTLKHAVNGVAAPIPHHQYSDVLLAAAPLTRRATSLPCGAFALGQQCGLTLERTQHQRFIGLGNTVEKGSAAPRFAKETMTPSVSGVPMDARTLRGLRKRLSATQRLGIGDPPLRIVQPGQCRAGQLIERPPARLAAPSRQTATPSPADYFLGRTSRTRDSTPLTLLEERFERGHGIHFQCPLHLPALVAGQ